MNKKICTKCNTEKHFDLFSKDKYRGDGLCCSCKSCRASMHKNWALSNIKELKEYDFKYRSENKEKLKEYGKGRRKIKNEYFKQREKTNLSFKIGRRIACRVRSVLKGKYKSSRTIELLGCSIEELKIHLQSKFRDSMSWENYGLYGWHIDHIRPCASFNLSDSTQQKACFNYLNLQPLWAKDNLTKSDKYEPIEV